MSSLFANTYAPPQWLTQEFLQSALRQGCRRGSLNVRTCSICPATNVGDNYLSQMFRASARVNSRRKGSENMSVVIKSMPAGDVIEEFVHEQKFFKRETDMLSETLPLLQGVLNEIGGQRLFAQLYYKQGPPDTSLVLEDLCESGFRSVDRLAGLDIQHSILAAESLAVFHAASLVAVERNPEIKELYAEAFWRRSNEDRVRGYTDPGFKNIVTCLKIWRNFPQEFIEKIERMRECGIEKLFKCTDMREGDLHVLNHGDVWLSNLMFKYENDSGHPTDMRFVDFQLSCYNTPAYDLIYFLFTSPKLDIRITRLDEILASYHAKLIETCRTLKHPLAISFDDLHKIIYDRLAFAYMITVVLMHFMIAESSEAVDLNKFLEKEEDDSAVRLSQNMRFKEVIETVLPFLDQQGVFD